MSAESTEQSGPNSKSRERIDYDSRMAFARLVRPETAGMDENDYKDITPDMLERAMPEKLGPSLYDLPDFNDFTSSYYDPVAHRKIHIALTPEERGKVARSAKDLGATVANRTLESRLPRADFMPDLAAAKRSSSYAISDRIETMQRYLDEVLHYEEQQIAFFREAAEHPGLSRGKEINLRMAMAYVQEYTFSSMYRALRLQRGWTPEQEDRARRSVEKRLYFERSHNQHIQNWRDMLDMLQTWNGYRVALFKNKILDARKHLTSNH